MNSNKPNIQKKLKSYSALAGTIAAAVSSADAQVIYTDVAPDSTVTNGIYLLDLNNDDVADFRLLQQSGMVYGYFSYDAVGVYALSAANAVDTSGGKGAATALDAGALVDASLNWVDSTQAATIAPIPTANGLAVVIPAFSYSAGNFLGVTGKFLPLRFTSLGNIYYGWVRLDVAADAKSFKVIDYAYTNIPNTYSITGALVGIAEAAIQNKVNIFSSDKNVTVQLDPLVAAEGTIEITNISGQKISETMITNTEMVVPMQEAKTGIYMVTVKQSSGSYTKRVFIK